MPRRQFRSPRRNGAVVLVEVRRRTDLSTIILVAFVLTAGVLFMH